MRLIHFYFLCVIFALGILPAGAQDSGVPENPDEDFVRAYVMVADPGKEIYSALGHACLRLVCPSQDMDYVFSYEGEDVPHQLAQFFAGKLKMGVRGVAAEEYIAQYRPEGRKVHQYELLLPIHVKQRLWMLMDEHVEEEDVPYDYVERGCAVSTLQWIIDAADPDSLQFGPWPSSMQRTRAEMGCDSVQNPWMRHILCTFTSGVAGDTELQPHEKVLAPRMLPQILARATYNGHPLIASADSIKATLPANFDEEWTPTLSPLKVAVKCIPTAPTLWAAALLLLALIGRWRKQLPWCLPTLIVGTLMTLFVSYLMFFSSLPNNEWNWLILVFNPLPLLLWKWRGKWGKTYFIYTCAWAVAMLFWPHFVLCPAHLILGIGWALCFMVKTPSNPPERGEPEKGRRQNRSRQNKLSVG